MKGSHKQQGEQTKLAKEVAKLPPSQQAGALRRGQQAIRNKNRGQS